MGHPHMYLLDSKVCKVCTSLEIGAWLVYDSPDYKEPNTGIQSNFYCQLSAWAYIVVRNLNIQTHWLTTVCLPRKLHEKCPGSLWKCRLATAQAVVGRGNSLGLAPSPTRKTRSVRHPKSHIWQTTHLVFPPFFPNSVSYVSKDFTIMVTTEV